MQPVLKKLLKKIKNEKTRPKDLHIIRFYSSFVVISNGKTINLTTPHMTYCPLAGSLYKKIEQTKDPGLLKQAITKSVDEKISKFGHFTKRRELSRSDIAIPYGASEILMYAIRKKAIDAAVVVCDGAGTVIVNRPELVQGIGARMNGLFYTSPIQEVIRGLKKADSCVVFQDAAINQIEGVEKAALLGYKKIAVTINACADEPLHKLGEIERKYKISVTSLFVCTTGINKGIIQEIGNRTATQPSYRKYRST